MLPSNIDTFQETLARALDQVLALASYMPTYLLCLLLFLTVSFRLASCGCLVIARNLYTFTTCAIVGAEHEQR